MIVGWYLLEAQVSMTKYGDYSTVESIEASQQVPSLGGSEDTENFSQWLKRKTSIVVDFVVQYIPVSSE